MGSCCSGRNEKIQSSDNECCIKSNMTTYINYDTNHLINQTQNDSSEQCEELFIMKLNRLVTSFPTLNIEIIPLDFIWNIIKSHQNDFNSTNYIIYDLRPKPMRKENFLKKFKCINYSIEEIEGFTENKAMPFKRFLNSKKIIIINDTEDAEVCETFLRRLMSYDIKSLTVLLLNTLLDDSSLKDDMKQLYQRMDDRWFNDYPYITTTLASFSYLKSSSYVFVDSENDWFDALAKNDDTNNKYEEFLKHFNIKIVVHLSNEKDVSAFTTLPNNILLIKLNIKMNITNSQEVCQMLELVKSYLLNQGSFVLLYDDKAVTHTHLVNWLVNITNQLTSFTLAEIKSMMKVTLRLFIKDITQIFELITQDNLLPICSSYTLRNHHEINHSFDSYLEQLKIEINSRSHFQAICSVIEKIVLNVLTHPKNDVYYKIKCNSNTFKMYIIRNKYARMAFEVFGFDLQTQKNEDYYYLNINTDLVMFREIYYCFINAVKRHMIGVGTVGGVDSQIKYIYTDDH